MLNTNYITYDGVVSINFGLQLGSFESGSGAQNTSIYSPEIKTLKANQNSKFGITKNDISAPPEYELILVSESTISPVVIRKIMRWLTADGGFKKLIINRQDLQGYYAMCAFKNIEEIKVNNYCVGFKMTAVLDSSYWYGETETIYLSNANLVDKVIQIVNKSDKDEYAYPQLKFTLNSGATNIKIVNLSDDEGRIFELENLPSNTQIIIDNELRIIDGSGVSLNNFKEGSMNWIRLIRGINNLSITMNGEGSITCPQYSLIGF